MLKHIETNFRTLPFAERWLIGVVPKEQHKAHSKSCSLQKQLWVTQFLLK